jgi:predicted esterase
MWAFERQLPTEWNVISYEAPLDDPDGGKSWWLLTEPMVEGALRAAQCFEDSYKRLDVNPSKVYLMGFSQGAALCSVLLQKGFKASGAALLCGFVPEIDAVSQANTRIFMFHGEQDQIISISQAERGRDYMKGLGATIEWNTEPVGHKLGILGMRALKDWFSCETNGGVAES